MLERDVTSFSSPNSSDYKIDPHDENVSVEEV